MSLNWDDTCKQIGRVLTESQEYFGLLSENIREAFWIWDAKESRFLFHSAASTSVYGFPPEVLNDFTIDDVLGIVHPDDRDSMMLGFREVMSQGEERQLEFRIIKKGQVAWLSARCFPVKDSGSVCRIVGITEDITDRKFAQEDRERLIAELELELERSRLDSLLVNAPVGFAFFNRELRYVRINEFLANMNGLPVEAHIGRKISEIVKGQPEAIESLLRQVFETGQAIELAKYSGEIAGNPGKVHHWLSSAYPVRGPDDSIPLLGVVVMEITQLHEVTEELKTAKDAAEAANHAKSQFLANMSHEIRTPLSVILGFAELIRDPRTSESQRNRYIDAVLRNGQDLARLIDDILDLSKVEAGRLTLHHEAISIPVILEEVGAMFEQRAKGKGLILEFHSSSSLPERIITDPYRLRQILTNLVDNAIKFTPKGTITVTARALPGTSDKALKVDFQINDTGMGLSDAQQRKIFQPFSQADQSTTRRFGGTGLGLYLSRYLAELLGGGINLLASKPGHGSLFSVQIAGDLPDGGKAISNSPENGFIVGSSKLEPRGLSHLRILVVEDAPDIQHYYHSVLHSIGIEPDLASNGEEAIAKVNSKTYDIIFMDMQMPVMDGYRATAKLRRQGCRSKILALTAHAMTEDRERCLNIGCDEYLAKPIRPNQLIETIEILDRSIS